MQVHAPIDMSEGTFSVGVVAAHAVDAPEPNAEGAPTRAFDESNHDDWNELARDLTAIANSGGGQIRLRAAIDEVVLRQRLSEINGLDLTIVQEGHPAVETTMITVGPAMFPIGHAENGVEAFYFRRGNQTELATSADMRQLFERSIQRVGRRWKRRIRRAINTPLAHDLREKGKSTTGKLVEVNSASLHPVRIVMDPDAPPLQPQDIDRLYPWRQKDLVRELNRRIGRRMLNSYDVQAVRRHHQLDMRPDFIFNLFGAGRRYSPAAADWIMDAYSNDPAFFQKSRAADQDYLKLRRQKPR